MPSVYATLTLALLALAALVDAQGAYPSSYSGYPSSGADGYLYSNPHATYLNPNPYPSSYNYNQMPAYPSSPYNSYPNIYPANPYQAYSYTKPTDAPTTTAAATTAAPTTAAPVPYYNNTYTSYPAPNIWWKLNLCPKVAPLVCYPGDWWRSIDGSCNNLMITWWGQSYSIYKRLAKPNYEDKTEAPRVTGKSGSKLPNPRTVATNVLYPKEKLKHLTHMFPVFGQYLMHDVSKLGHTVGADRQIKKCECGSRSRDCINVKLPEGDRLYGDNGECLTQIRERDSREDFNCDLGTREHTNEATSWVDLSPTYGSTVEQARSLRAYIGGRLKAAYESNPHDSLMPSECTRDTFMMVRDTKVCFQAGDDRVNSHVLLTGIQTIFLRYHNILVTELARVNPQWNDEQLYQEGRRLNIAIFQQIAYAEWLPIMIGPELHKLFDLGTSDQGYFYGYNDKVFGNVAIEFAGAAARIGHALMGPYFSRVDEHHRRVDNMSLHDCLFRPDLITRGNHLTQFMRGCLKDLAWQLPPHINSELMDWLVVDHGNKNPAFFHSLPTINVNRGRDLGLRFYNDYRRLAGLKPLKSFKHMSWISEKNAKNLREVYKSVEDIELYPGGLSETPVSHGVVGPTFGYILARGFRDWKYGDRWWFENPANVIAHPFAPAELKTIRKMTFASILCSTMNIKKVQRHAFFKESYENPFVSCSEIYQLNFNAFKASWGGYMYPQPQYQPPQYPPSGYNPPYAPYYPTTPATSTAAATTAGSETTSEPEATTAAPVASTAAPVASTAAPEASTAAPATATPEAATVTPAPIQYT